MADPVSALAAVATVSSFIQVIDFSVKVLYNAGKLLREDNVGEVAPLTRLVEQYAVISRLLQEDQTQPLSASDTSVDALATKCRDTSGELLDMLSGLKLGDTTNPVKKAAKAVKLAGKAAWKKNEIEHKQKHLNELNALLGTAILNSLRKTQITFQEDLFERMTRDTQDVLDAVRTATTSVTDEAKRQIAKAARIANSLRFPEMLRRRDGVPESYETTFEWAFDDQQCHFSEWLEKGNGVFWMSGKAGSGKSTLMKFLTGHDTTQTLCQQWAGGESLLVRADFYFWYSGSLMQKSVLGLLQSLLYQIFKGCPDLVRRVCPNRWACDDFDMMETYPWSEAELEEALRLSAAEDCRTWVGEEQCRKEVPVRYVFFIDGLDEYAGDHRELAELVTSLAESNHVKLCISSRPWTHFTNAFEQSGKYMRLEDHTGPDIATYVRGELTKAEKKNRHHRRTLAASQSTDSLIQSIIERAKGVFFWVFLVVRSLSDGFANGDSIVLLQKRVLDLPSKLKDYFALILQRLDGTYRRLTAQVLHLVYLSANERINPFWSVSFIDLWPLHEQPDFFESEDFYLKAAYTELQSDDLRDMLLHVTRMVRAWCRDFLYVPAAQAIGQSDSDLALIEAGKVEFLHRTVYDFLVTEDVQANIRANVPSHFYERSLPWRLTLARLRSIPISAPHQACQWFNNESSRILPLSAEESPAPSLLPRYVLRTIDECGTRSVATYCGVGSCPNDGYNIAEILISYAFFDLASEMLQHENFTVERADDMLYNYLNKISSHELINIDLVRRLLEAGADVDQAGKNKDSTHGSVKSPILWTSLIGSCREHARTDMQREHAWDLIKLFLEFGADPEIQLPEESRSHAVSDQTTLVSNSRPLRLREALKAVVPHTLIHEVDPLIKKYSSISARVEASERRERLRKRGS